MKTRPVGAVLEIVERSEASTGDIVVPNELRLNGVPMLVPEDAPIVFHEMGVRGQEFATATLTLMVRRVIISHEQDLAQQPIIYGDGNFTATTGSQPHRPVVIERRFPSIAGPGVVFDQHGLTVDAALQLIDQLKGAVNAAVERSTADA